MKNKTVFISGAGKGIGRACAEAFAHKGTRLILVSRSREDLERLEGELHKKHKTECLIHTLDVRDRRAVQAFIQDLPPEWRDIDILINNAGLALGLDKLHEGLIEDWEEMIDSNIKGLLYLTRAIVPLMLDRKRQGHIINIGSTAGIHAYPGGNVYCATKAAVRFISDGLRQDLVDTPLRVTNIQPGMVETNFSHIRFHGDEQKAKQVYQGIEPLHAEDVADAVLYAASVPAHVQICEITLTPAHQATGGVVYREK